MSNRIITRDNKLFIIFKLNDVNGHCSAYSDIVIEKVCRGYLDNLAKGNGDYFYTAQELVWSVIRSLLYKEYKHLQEQVEFYIEDSGTEYTVLFNEKMRMSKHPPSVWDDALCKLLGAEENDF